MENKPDTIVKTTPKHHVVIFAARANFTMSFAMGEDLIVALEKTKFADLVKTLDSTDELPSSIPRHDPVLVSIIHQLEEITNNDYRWRTIPIYSDSYVIRLNSECTVDGIDYWEEVICGSELIKIHSPVKVSSF